MCFKLYYYKLVLLNIFLDQELIPYHYSSHLVVLLDVLVRAMLFKKSRGSVISNRTEMKFGRIFLQVNLCQIFDTTSYLHSSS